MAYDKTDPRSMLASSSSSKPKTGLVAEPQVAKFYDMPPTLSDQNGASWLVRGHNFVLAQTDSKAGGVFAREDQPDEYVLLLPNGGATITVDGETVSIPGNSIAFVPPGKSEIVAREAGRIFRLFTCRSADLVSLCPNATAYDTPRLHIPDFNAWPTPANERKVRHYSLDVPREEGRQTYSLRAAAGPSH